MLLEHHYLDCLSQGSYIVADPVSRQAVVIDPRRDVDCYLDSARENELTIVGIVMTHFHADFVAGHLELAAATGAWIGLGSRARGEVDYPVRYLEHGELVSLGSPATLQTQTTPETDGGLVLEILHTPGHTWESISILAHEGGTPRALFSGDTLFVGDVGRPDLAAAVGAVPTELARAQYRSLHDVILALPDDVTVHPSHGAGSACGKALGSEKSSTVGKERRTNPALAPMTEDEFVAWLMADQPPAPLYFAEDAVKNRRQRHLLDASIRCQTIDANIIDTHLADGAVIIDTRDPDSFAERYVVGAINVGIDGRFAETAGMFVSTDRPIILVTEPGREDEAAMRLGRVGFDRLRGSLGDLDEFFAIRPDLQRVAERADVASFTSLAEQPETLILDVRSSTERADGAIPGSFHIPLAGLVRELDKLPANRPVAIHCAGGWRSSVAASALRTHGYQHVTDLRGGYAAWATATEATRTGGTTTATVAAPKTVVTPKAVATPKTVAAPKTAVTDEEPDLARSTARTWGDSSSLSAATSTPRTLRTPSQDSETHRVTIIGDGAASLLTAAALLEDDAPVRVTVIGRNLDDWGRGVAYGACADHHVLNSRAAAMSAHHDDPGHFVRWTDERGFDIGARDFAPRAMFGAYLSDVAAQLRATAGGRLSFVFGEAAHVDADGRVTLTDGVSVVADSVILALGNAPTSPIAVRGRRATVPDPWAAAVLDLAASEVGALGDSSRSAGNAQDEAVTAHGILRPGDTVGIVGTGLTAIDVAMTLARTVPGVRIVAASRTGMLPKPHSARAGHGSLKLATSGLVPTMRALIEELRRTSADGEPWQNVIDAVRPSINDLWQSWTLADQQRFIARYSRRWETIRLPYASVGC